MLIRFSIEAEKVLEALGRNYDLPGGLDWGELEKAEKSVYLVNEDGDFVSLDILLEVAVGE